MELKDIEDEKMVRAILMRARKPFADAEKEQEFIDALNSKFNTSITSRQLKNLLGKTREYLDIVDELFNPNDGIISGFRFDRNFPSEMGLPSSKLKLPTEFAEKAGRARLIEPSVQAIENKNNILEALEDAKKYRPNRNIGVIIPPEAFNVLDRMTDSITDLDEDIEFKEPTDFASITALLKSLTEITRLPTKDRDDYYDYWASVQESFSEIQPFIDITEDIENVNIAMGGAQGEEQLKTLSQQLTTLLGEDKILPSYIIEFKPVRVREYDDAQKSILLLEKFFKLIGKELPKEYKNLLPERDLAAQADTTAAFNPETGQNVAEIDAELLQAIEEAIEAAEKAKVDVMVDPLFAVISNNTGVFNVDENILQATKALIDENLTFDELEFFSDELKELLDDEVETYFKEFRERVTSSKQEFYMPVMDAAATVSFFDSLGSLTMNVSYYQKGVVKNKSFTKYSNVVKFINDNTKQFFEHLNQVLNIQNRKSGLLSNPKTGKREGTDITFRGGKTIPTPVRAPKIDEKMVENYEEILNLFEKFYNAPLNSSYIIRDDTPEFFDDKYFRDIPILLTKNAVSLSAMAMLSGVSPIADRNDYQNIIKLLRTLNNPDELVYSDILNNTFEDALDSYVKFWALVAVVAEEGEFDLIDLRENATLVLGDALYEIAKETESPEKLREIKFAGEPLVSLNERQSKKRATLRGLLPLLGQKEWKTYVQNMGENQRALRSSYDQLVRMLRESDIKLAGDLTVAMLEANDLLRKMKGLSVSNAQLDITDIDDLSFTIDKIKKEHNVDLYGVDIYQIVKSQSSFNDIANTFGLTSEIVYKVKGLFR